MGQAPNVGKWLSRLHFNSGMFRLAAGYERVLRLLTKEPRAGRECLVRIAIAEKHFSEQSVATLNRIYTMVNKLKHDPAGLTVKKGRTVNLIDAIRAVRQLLLLAAKY